MINFFYDPISAGQQDLMLHIPLNISALFGYILAYG